ncbi:MAG: alpha/beta hydrolase [Streptosporangiaceae bacterium]
MGGGEVAQTEDNPQGPLTQEQADDWTKSLTADREAFFDQFTTQFFSAGGELKVTEAQRQDALAMCLQSGEGAALACMESFGTTDFRPDLPNVTVPALVLHGDADGTIPFEGSGQRTHLAIPDSELVVLDGAPHGCNVSHARELSDLASAGSFCGRGHIHPARARPGQAASGTSAAGFVPDPGRNAEPVPRLECKIRRRGRYPGRPGHLISRVRSPT